MTFPLEIPPGVARSATAAAKSSNWRETNLIRWKNGRMSPIGGWERQSLGPFASKLRRVHTWSDNNGIKRTLYLCEGHAYIDEGGTLIDISPDPAIVMPSSDTEAGGFGDYSFSYDTFGTPRPVRTRLKVVAPCYSVYNWGEEILFMTSADGRLLRWRPSAPLEVANPVPDAPAGNRCFVVTPERHVMLFTPLGNFRRFSWCSQENYSEWTVGVDTTAGFFDVEPAAQLVAASLTTDGVIFWTTTNCYIARYSGVPYVYSYNHLADGTTPVSYASVSGTAVGTIWKSDSGFWIYNGAGVAPLECPIIGWIDDDYHEFLNRYEAASVNVVTVSEMWWFYTTSDAEENNRFVIYNYREGWWSMGKAGRTCGFSSSYDSYPIMCDPDYVYKHEFGTSYPDADGLPYAETFTLNMGDGGVYSTIRQVQPDVGSGVDTVNLRFLYKGQRSGGVEIDSGVKTIRDDGFVDVFETGRDFRMRVESINSINPTWTFGQFLVDIVPRGRV